jgi:DNA polymerase IV (archaeal DinB-like DNA polymerase)
LERVIGHIDLDYFYAQVEEVENPSLKEGPVIVCVFSGRTEESGVVSTANYRARELGVHSGMPIVLAKKKLEGKNAAVIKMEHEKYEIVSNRIMDDLAQRVDILEPTGIDEAFFDLTSSTGGDYTEAQKRAQTIKESILNNEHLTCSVGIGRSKIVAKLGSDIAKPGGLKIVAPETTMTFLAPLPVTKLYGVGPKTASTFEEMGIKTINDLARTNFSALNQIFGRKFGAYLLAAAKGEDDDPVRAGHEPTQFSRIVTLKRDTREPREAFDQLAAGIEYVHDKLMSSGKSFKTVTAIGILTDLSTKTKSKTFETPVNDASILRDSTLVLFEELSGAVGKDFRRVGLRVSGFTSVEDQTSLSEFLRQ